MLRTARPDMPGLKQPIGSRYTSYRQIVERERSSVLKLCLRLLNSHLKLLKKTTELV